LLPFLLLSIFPSYLPPHYRAPKLFSLLPVIAMPFLLLLLLLHNADNHDANLAPASRAGLQLTLLPKVPPARSRPPPLPPSRRLPPLRIANRTDRSHFE
jgi:hypothetical protein